MLKRIRFSSNFRPSNISINTRSSVKIMYIGAHLFWYLSRSGVRICKNQNAHKIRNKHLILSQLHTPNIKQGNISINKNINLLVFLYQNNFRRLLTALSFSGLLFCFLVEDLENTWWRNFLWYLFKTITSMSILSL